MDFALHNAWLIPLFPFAGFSVIILTGKKNLGVKAAVIALTMLGCSAVLSVLCALATFGAHPHNPEHFEPYVHNMFWARLAQSPLEIGYQIDTLTCVMLLVVTLIGWLIHLYSVGYMEKDPRFTRFFAYLQLFCCAMLMLVLANNYLVLYAGWEGVGLCSYLLIGFWFEKPSAAKAAKKAFLVTRTGDCGLALGIFLLFAKTKTIMFQGIFAAAQAGAHGHGEQVHQLPFSFATLKALLHSPYLVTQPQTDHFVFTLAALLIFFGAVGKSAQFPLHVWLPDAMEGPTPVSALIHAATMVAAGVYLVARSYPLFTTGGHEIGVALQVVAWIGAITAFMAATIAVAQNDIKRVLAYSTISQLGFMMLGLGCLGFTAGVFHLMTHAFFKALLFLGSGSVIHGMEHGHHAGHPGADHEAAHGEPFDPQDMRQMGGLAKYMPVTCWTYWAGMLALSGIPPLAGFWSKDEILADAFAQNKGVWFLGAAAAFLTAFYMGRQMFMVFHGELRAKDCHPHESPWTMIWPLRILAVGAIGLGLLGTPWANVFHHYVHYGEHRLPANYVVMLLSIVIAAAGILLARNLYGVTPLKAGQEDPLEAKLGPLWAFLQNKWYFDELYDFLIIQPLLRLTRCCYRFDQKAVDGTVNFVGLFGIVVSRISAFLDKWVVDGIVNLIGIVTRASGNLLKLTQNGLAQTYMLVVFAGAMVVVVIRMMSG